MEPNKVKEKFGDDYFASEITYIMGIDLRFSIHFAERFVGFRVLETCTGAGFTTISLAKTARHVVTVEIDPDNQRLAMKNVKKAGCDNIVTFVSGDVMREEALVSQHSFDAAFLDPDWAVAGSEHIYRFKNSNTRPPADVLLKRMLKITNNVALVLPPFIPIEEFMGLPPHERESLYLNESHELYCLYFGELMRSTGATEFRVK